MNKEKILRKLNLKKIINMVIGSFKGANHDHPGIVDEKYYPSLGKRVGKTIYAEIKKVISSVEPDLSQQVAAMILTEIYNTQSTHENYLHMVHFVNALVSEDEDVQAQIEKAFERGKETGIVMASAPCLFCKKKTNECECGYTEITMRNVSEFCKATRPYNNVFSIGQLRNWLE